MRNAKPDRDLHGGLPTGVGPISLRRLRVTPKANRTVAPRKRSLARRHILVGDSPGDEERSDRLSLDEDREEGVCDGALGTPESEEYQESDRVYGIRLDEHHDDGGVRFANTGCGTHNVSDFASVQEKPYDDRKREEEVERSGDRII